MKTIQGKEFNYGDILLYKVREEKGNKVILTMINDRDQLSKFNFTKDAKDAPIGIFPYTALLEHETLTNMKQIRKLGPLENILKMLPGARNMGLNNININPKDMAHVEAIVLSMTPYERKHPEVLKASRKIRIAKGSGRSVEEVNRLLKQFDTMKDMMKKMSSGNFKMPF